MLIVMKSTTMSWANIWLTESVLHPIARFGYSIVKPQVPLTYEKLITNAVRVSPEAWVNIWLWSITMHQRWYTKPTKAKERTNSTGQKQHSWVVLRWLHTGETHLGCTDNRKYNGGGVVVHRERRRGGEQTHWIYE